MQQAMTAGTPAVASPRGKARQAHLLAVACEHFLAHGYDGASMDAIVAEAGGSKATLYRHFGSKQVLFVSCVGHLCDEFLARLEGIDLSAPVFEDGLRVILMELVEVMGSPRHVDFYRLVVAGSSLTEVGRAWFEHGPKVWHRLIARLIARHVTQGSLPEAAGRASAAPGMIFDCLFSHLAIESVILGRRIDRRGVAARVDEIVSRARGLLLAQPV